jgi:hypothetical protein
VVVVSSFADAVLDLTLVISTVLVSVPDDVLSDDTSLLELVIWERDISLLSVEVKDASVFVVVMSNAVESIIVV